MRNHDFFLAFSRLFALNAHPDVRDCPVPDCLPIFDGFLRAVFHRQTVPLVSVNQIHPTMASVIQVKRHVFVVLLRFVYLASI
jgi:hypothetical protein